MQTQIRTIKAACNNWEEALTHPETLKLIQTFEKFAINAKKNIRTTNEKETKVAEEPLVAEEPQQIIELTEEEKQQVLDKV